MSVNLSASIKAKSLAVCAVLVIPFGTETSPCQFKNCGSSVHNSTVNAGVLNYSTVNLEVEGNSMENPEVAVSLKRLDSFLDLEEDWNGYGAPVFRKPLIDFAKNVVRTLSHQPEIFPIAGGAIQFEYEKPSGEYLEFELYEDGSVHRFQIFEDGTEQEDDMHAKDIDKVVRGFYVISFH